MSQRGFASALAFCAFSLPLLASARARAAESDSPPLHAPLPGSDGVYGRFDGSLALAASAGAELEAGDLRGALRFSAHYLWTAGVYLRYSDAFGSADSRPGRVASLGVDLRPLFLPRFARDYEQGPALLDLTLDSLSLTAGAYFAQPRGRDFGDERGFETGLGLALPLLAQARGPWLEARGERRFADRGENAWLVTLSVSFVTLTWSTDRQPR
jgi:hypothetical protein